VSIVHVKNMSRGSEKMKDLTVILPTLNEGGNIAKMINKIHGVSKYIKIIVADDGSKDATQSIVHAFSRINKSVRLIDRSKEHVKGLSVSAWHGICECKTKYFIVMDADGQHPIHLIKELYLLRNCCDYAIASRKELPSEWPLKRKIISRTATGLAQLSLAVRGQIDVARLKDPMSGMFMGLVDEAYETYCKYKDTKLELTGYKILFDIIKYSKNGTRIGQVFYNDFNNRESGESKLGKKQIQSMLRAIFK